MKDVLISYPVNCDGVLPKKGDTSTISRPEASLTVFRDGRREIGCSYIDEGKCTLTETLINGRLPICAHLFPASVSALRKKESSGEVSNENWPYHFKKTSHQKDLESRFPGRRLDDLIREAIYQTPSLNEAAQLLGISLNEIFSWKNQFDIKLPKRHRTRTL